MISQHVRMLDINPVQWRHLFEALFPAPGPRLIVVHEAGRIVKAFDTRTGLRSDLRTKLVDDPQVFAARIHESEAFSQVFVLERDALDEYFVSVHRLYDSADDGDVYLAEIRMALAGDPRLVCFPPLGDGPSLGGVLLKDWIHLAAGVPDGSVVVLGILSGNAIWGSVIVRIVGGQLELVTTSDAILPVDAAVDGLLDASRQILVHTAERIGPVHAGLFCTHAAFLSILGASDKPAAIAAEQVAGRLIINPMPTSRLL